MTTQTIQHQDYCRDRRAASERYQATYPQHCRTCHGAGQVDASDDSVGFYGADPCDDCTALGNCPRCNLFVGVVGGENGSTPCPWCGFVLDQSDYDEGADCTCWDHPDPDAAWRDWLDQDATPVDWTGDDEPF